MTNKLERISKEVVMVIIAFAGGSEKNYQDSQCPGLD
jgi:hypothetical protein